MKLLTPEGMKIATLTLITDRTRQEEFKNAQYFSLLYFLQFSYFGFWLFQLEKFIFQEKWSPMRFFDFPTFCWFTT